VAFGCVEGVHGCAGIIRVWLSMCGVIVYEGQHGYVRVAGVGMGEREWHFEGLRSCWLYGCGSVVVRLQRVGTGLT